MRRASVAVGLAWALAACEHARPFAQFAEPNVPFSSGFPRQLTFNTGDDGGPAWLPDGSGIIYSYELPQPDHDQCLGILPALGGHRTWSLCPPTSPLGVDTTNALTEPALGPDSALAYLRISQALGARAPNSVELVVATLGSPAPGRVVLTVPYTAPDSLFQVSISDLRWLDAHTLVWVAQVGVDAGPPTVPFEIVRLDLSTAPAGMTVLAGTAGASSLAVDSGGVLYYTRQGDSRVYRWVGGAAPDTVYDFGAAGAPVGVQVRGNLLVGDVNGALLRVDLGSQSLALFALPGGTVFNPALSPSATRVVVEASTGGSLPDLWLLEVP